MFCCVFRTVPFSSYPNFVYFLALQTSEHLCCQCRQDALSPSPNDSMLLVLSPKKKEFDSMALASSKRKLVFEITKDHFCLRFWYLLLFKIKHFQVRVSCICKIPLVSDCWFYILINNWFFSLISDRCVSLWLWAWIS